MTTITSVLSWSGTNTYLQTDNREGMTSSDTLTEASSETTGIAEGDTVSISRTAQSASNYSYSSEDGGSNTLAKIFDAATSVITNSSSTDEEKLAAYVAVKNIEFLSSKNSYTPMTISKDSPDYKLSKMYVDFINATKDTAFMQTVRTIESSDSYQTGGSPLSTALEAYKRDLSNAEMTIGSVIFSATVTETTEQTATGTTTGYSFSYDLGITSLPDIGRSTTILDPVGVLNGTVSSAGLATMCDAVADDNAISSSSTESTVSRTASVLGIHKSAQQTLAEEIATDLFGSGDKTKKTDITA